MNPHSTVKFLNHKKILKNTLSTSSNFFTNVSESVCGEVIYIN